MPLFRPAGLPAARYSMGTGWPTEVTDYALFDDHDEIMDCQCQTPSCRGTISGRDWQRPDLQRKYRTYFSSYLLRRLAHQPDQRR